ncbi:receptor protein-tyrosine kinase [Povalibacter uvarum]|uniref:non-specific protein-tyrosine kinase n=1 Tax=Povalibacter uvarum TaxID=732238 RepID=A0A841HGR9_9GAMM|nr:XrtA-associated tyrosine autokinase [Povalibacter uvarum]MBB6091629.1 receptor protein-tyrosine kinase [Povalibacter uvarum]
MSLVELAIKKMQAAARGASDAPVPQPPAADRPRTVPLAEPAPVVARLAPGVVGEMVSTGVHRALGSQPVEHRTDKMLLVDRRALRAAGLMPPENQERALADQYRHIKRPLIAAATGRGGQRLDRGQLIMMASAMPGEGKTFTSINLALSMALEKDISVLLVDADVPKPHISRTFGVESELGLLDVLRDRKTTVESVIIPTDVPNLSILPAGVRSDTATELLASHRMEETVNHLATANPRRVVVIDSPPLLLTSESRALAHWVGQIVLVIRAGFTPQQAVMDAIAFLGENKSIGLILNQSNTATPGYYYGYGDATTVPSP